jgi:hypothetical protein
MGKPKTRKKGWKRLARDPDQQVDEALRRARVAQAPDAELFFEDVAGHQCQLGPKKVEPLDETTLTVRQRAALKYRRERAE